MTVLQTNLGDDPAARLRAAEAHLRARRWPLAAQLLQPLAAHDVKARLQWHLARNLAVLEAARPDTYRQLIATPARGEYQVAATPTGKLSVMHRPSCLVSQFKWNRPGWFCERA